MTVGDRWRGPRDYEERMRPASKPRWRWIRSVEWTSWILGAEWGTAMVDRHYWVKVSLGPFKMEGWKG